MTTMRYTTLGHTGLKVSKICVGCMTYGTPGLGNQPWSLGEAESRPFIRQALEGGINFFDTANVYSNGESERIVGRALKEMAPRDEIVVATKAYFPWKNRPNGAGLSRKALFAAIDTSLHRLGMDYVDLYQIHRWDEATPIEETMEALHDIVKAGKALYLGASSMYAWQFFKAQNIAERRGWTPFVSMQPHYNLIYREDEREMLPLCADLGVGVIPWSPLARGKLTRPADQTSDSGRAIGDKVATSLYGSSEAADRAVITAVQSLAAKRGVTMSQIALAWVTAKPTVTSPIIGASKAKHLEEAITSLDVQLTAEEVASLESNYAPHAVSGAAAPQMKNPNYDAPTLLASM